MTGGIDVGIDALTYWVPEHAPTLAELEQAGALRGPASTLASFGFERARVARSESHVDMAAHAVRRARRAHRAVRERGPSATRVVA